MDNNYAEIIEQNLNVMRTIKNFIYDKGFYPLKFKTGLWDEKDYDDPDYRELMKKEFYDYSFMLVEINIKVIPLLKKSLSNLESAYNRLIIDARNLDPALTHFRKQFEDAVFSIENKCGIFEVIRYYLSPLIKHGIINDEECDSYQRLVCDIGRVHSGAVSYICDLFEIKKPWDPEIIEPKSELEHHENSDEKQKDPNEENIVQRKQSKRIAEVDALPQQTLACYIGYCTNDEKNSSILAESVIKELKNCISSMNLAALVVAMEDCEYIHHIKNGLVKRFWEYLKKEHERIVGYESFNRSYNILYVFHNKEKPFPAKYAEYRPIIISYIGILSKAKGRIKK